jgi:hypothetical protein
MPKTKKADEKIAEKVEEFKALPAQIFALWKAASTDEERTQLRCVRIEPSSAMATDGHMLLKLIPAEKFDIKEPFTVESEMCAQILKAKALTGEAATITVSHGDGPLAISVGRYKFLPTAQLDLFTYESHLEQKQEKIGEIAFKVETLEKLLKALRAVGVETFHMYYAGEEDPVKIEASAAGMDRVTGAVMPARA